MKRSYPGTLRPRLALRVLFAVLPAFGLALLSFVQERRRITAEAYDDALRLPQVQGLNGEACTTLATNLLGPRLATGRQA